MVVSMPVAPPQSGPADGTQTGHCGNVRISPGRRREPGAGRRRRAARSCARWRSTCAPAATRCSPPPTAPQALATAAAHPPDLVMLDLGLPDMDGVEVIRGLRGWTDRADHRAVRPRPTARDKVDALDAGRRRLRHQAVRHGRAAGPDAGRAAPRPAADDAGEPVVEPRRVTVDLAAPPGRDARHGGDVRLTPDRVAPARGAASATPASWSASAQLLQRGLGTRRTRPRRTTCACTWRSCGTSSRPTRPGRATCSPSPGWATASSPEPMGRLRATPPHLGLRCAEPT